MAERPQQIVYSIPGAIFGSIIGGTGGSVLGVYTASRIIEKVYEMGGRRSFEKLLFIPATFEGETLKYSLAMLLIPALFAAGASIGAYIGGRLFGKTE
ncbi:MAG: hypothetical protein QXO57_00395 [Candidatus Aenigmatarchaeota archaeon]|nr:hypothetical protein [Candidatus Aenigmarchaeota archaeon]